MIRGEKVQQTGQCWQGRFGTTGQFCPLQGSVPSLEAEQISTLLKVFSNEKTTSGNTEKHNINIKKTFSKRIRCNFMTMITKLRDISTLGMSKTIIQENMVELTIKINKCQGAL